MFKVLLLSTLVFAAKEHGAHSHGAGQVSIGFDEKKGKIEMHIPGDTLFGFEHEAKAKKDVQTKNDALKKLEENIAAMIVFDPSLGCEIKLDVYEVNQEANHSDVDIDFNVTCKKAVVGSAITFNFQKYISRFKKAQVNVIADSVQKSVQVTKNGDTLDLK